MAKKLLIRMTAFATAMAMVVLGAGAAIADTVYNTIDGTIDASAEAVNFAAGDTTARTVTLRLTADSSYGESDPHSGCNLGGNVNDASLWQGGKTGAAALKLTATSSNTGVATVTSPSAFTNCANQDGYQQTLSVTPVGPGNTTVTFAIDTAASKWRRNSNVQLNTASFTVSVASPNAADPCDTATVPAAPDFTAASPNGDNGWFKATVPASVPAAAATSTTSDAVISYSTDGGTTFGSVPTLGEGTTTVIAKATAATCATKSSTTSRTFKVDTVNPTIGHTVTGATPATSGWYTTAPTVTFQCADTGGSGVASCVVNGSNPASASVTLSDGGDQSVSGTATDLAGNQASDTATDLDVDTTNPSVSVTGFTADATYILGQTLPTPACNYSDATSGIDLGNTDTTPTQTGTLGRNGTGTLTFTCGAQDNAGRRNSASKSYSISYGGDATSGFKILQPINTDNTSVFSRGKVVPVKFKLAGDEPSGFDVTGWTIQRSRVHCASMAEDGLTPEIVPASNPAGLRYDSGADQYIQNSDFRNAEVGSCWKVRGLLDNLQVTDWSGVFKITK